MVDDPSRQDGPTSGRGLQGVWPSRDDERPSVWIVDDSVVHAELCRAAVGADIDVRIFNGGASLLEALASSSPPHVVVLDWLMPDISGIDVCRFIRTTTNLVELPILILTVDPASLVDGLRSGANDFVQKPFAAEELKARVLNLIGVSLLHRKLLHVEGRLRTEAEFRERFMGILAHDLRQPLATMTMAAHALSAPETPREKAGAFRAMHVRASERMQRMIAELLDFTRNRPETGMPLHRRRTDFAEVAETCLLEMRAVHPDRHFNLKFEGDCSGMWDPDRLAQVCGNLVSNAVEHGFEDSALLIRVRGSDESVELAVTNHGPGIASADVAQIFRPFQRARAGRSRSNGVGLGLHIVDQIVRAHAGTIVVESNGDVTSFVVTLPRTVPA